MASSMNCNKIFILAITIILANLITCKAQIVSFHIGSGIGSYQMNDLKEFTSVINDDLPFDAKLVSNFPIYWNYNASMDIQIRKAGFGVVYLFQSTGNHLAQGDYSGHYNLKLNVLSHAPALRFTYAISEEPIFPVRFYTLIGVHFSKLDITEEMRLYEENVLEQEFEFKSLDPFMELGINASYSWKRFTFNISGGYQSQLGKQVLESTDDNAFELKNPQTGDDVGVDWSGFRLTAGVGFKLKSN